MARRKTQARRPARQRPELKPARLTPEHIAARDHKDLSTYEINCRVGALMTQEQEHAESEARHVAEVARLRKARRSINAVVQALETIVEERR